MSTCAVTSLGEQNQKSCIGVLKMEEGKIFLSKFLHTCTEVRLAASTQDGIKLRLVSSNFVFPSSVQFLSDTRQLKKRARPCMFIDVTTIKQYQTWASCLAMAMSTVSRSSRLPWIDEGACLLILHYVGRLHWQVHMTDLSLCSESSLWIRCKISSGYLAERDQESAEVTRGVAADGVLQALPVLWKEGGRCFF